MAYVFGHRLGHHEEHDHVERDADRDTPGPEQPTRHDAGQRGLHRLADVDGEQQRVDPPLGLIDQLQQGRPGATTLVGERYRLGLGHLGQAHLGDRQEDQHQQQQEDDDQHQRVGALE